MLRPRLCGDSSGKGYAYHETWASDCEILDAAGGRERWRLLVPERPSEDREAAALAGVAADCPWLMGGEEFDAIGEDEDASVARRTAAKTWGPHDDEYVTGLVPALPAS